MGMICGCEEKANAATGMMVEIQKKFDEKLGNLEQENSLLKAHFVNLNNSKQGEKSN